MIKKVVMVLCATSLVAGVQAQVLTTGFESGLPLTDEWSVVATEFNQVIVEDVRLLESQVSRTHDGFPNVNVASFYGVGSLRREISTVAGQDYKISFWLLNTASEGDGHFFVKAGGGVAFEQIDNFDRNTLGADGFLIHDAWHFYSDDTLSFKAESDKTWIEFGSGVLTSGVFGLDDVSVTAVPEPSALGMMLLGLGGLGMWSRRQRVARS